MTIDEQIAYLTKGCVDVVRPGELRAKLERAGEDRPEADGQSRVRSDRAGPAPRPHRPDPQDEALPGSRPHRRLRGRLVHRADRRSDRPLEDAPAVDDGGDRARTRKPTRRRSSRFSIRQKTVTRFNSEWLEPLGSVGWIKLAAKYNVAQMLERREFRQRYEAGKPIAMHEFLYPLAQAYDSVVLQRRRRARRDRSAVQPQCRARPDAGVRSRAADCDDDAAARRARRRREDVEEPGQLCRRHRKRAPRCSAS